MNTPPDLTNDIAKLKATSAANALQFAQSALKFNKCPACAQSFPEQRYLFIRKRYCCSACDFSTVWAWCWRDFARCVQDALMKRKYRCVTLMHGNARTDTVLA